MPGLVPGIHAFARAQDVDGREQKAFMSVFDGPFPAMTCGAGYRRSVPVRLDGVGAVAAVGNRMEAVNVTFALRLRAELLSHGAQAPGRCQVEGRPRKGDAKVRLASKEMAVSFLHDPGPSEGGFDL